MTLAEIKAMNKDVLLPSEAAGPLGCNPHYIRVAAKKRPELLGFPVTLVGNRVKIPSLAFIQYMEGTLENEDAPPVVAHGRGQKEKTTHLDYSLGAQKNQGEHYEDHKRL